MFLKNLSVWIRKYLLWIISAIVIIVGVTIIVVLFRDDNSSNNSLSSGSSSTNEPGDSLINDVLQDDSSSTNEPDNSSDNDSLQDNNSSTNKPGNSPDNDSLHDNSSSTNKPDDSSDNDSFQNVTYSCELMYNGQSLDNEDVAISWVKKLATYDSSISIDKTNISSLKKGLLGVFENAYVIKDKNFVRLYISYESEPFEYVVYDINNKKFNAGKLWSAKDKNTQVDIETTFNNAIKVSQDKDSFTYGNFGFILIYPSIYTNNRNETSSGEVNIDYNKYTGLGDLVCKTAYFR